MTKWHARSGGRGIIIYWHVEKRATCVYSQLKQCSSSEFASRASFVIVQIWISSGNMLVARAERCWFGFLSVARI